MAVYVVGLALLLAFAGYSDATYCVCKTGLSDSVLQKNIDYACGNGADCSQINQNGPCFNPNTVHDHCNYAVNSYYQKKASLPGSCDFQGTATPTDTPPTTASSSCVYPSSPGTGGGSTTPSTGTPPGTGTPTGGTPLTPTTPSTPGTGTGTTPGTGTGTTPGTGTGTTPGAGTGTFPGGGTTSPPSFGGISPTGSGGFGGSTDDAPTLSSTFVLLSTIHVITISAFVYAMM